MTQDEIIEMARQAGLIAPSATLQEDRTHDRAIKAFAKLVAEKAFNDGYAIGEARGFKEGVKLERKVRGEA